MSDSQSKCIVGFGKHASATDFTTSPVSFMHLLPERHTFTSPDTVRLRRAPSHPQNKGFAPLRGPIDMSQAYELEQILRGLSGNSGGAIDPELTTDVAQILDVAFGTDSVDPSGVVTTATGGTGASKILVVTEQARFPIGTVIMFTSSTGTFVRQVRARAASSGAGNLTLDRTFTGTVQSHNVIRCARWKADPAIYEHTHGGFFVEYDNERRLYLGGLCTARMDFSRGQYGKLITSWRFTDVQDIAEADPTFSEPTAGSALVRMNNKFWIGDDAYYSTDLSVDLGGSVVARSVDDSPHGVLGYLNFKGGDAARPKLSVKLLRGVNTGEVADSTGTLSRNKAQSWDKALGDAQSTLDVAFQVGGAAAAFGYGVMSAATITSAKDAVIDGYKMLELELEATGPTDTNLAPFEFHLG